jgi:Spy/CpxP family protein refolding chaperone
VSAAEKAVGELQTALDNKNAKSGEIDAKLTALRAAKKKTGKDLTDAQTALGELLTPRQEAQLVLMGLLE